MFHSLCFTHLTLFKFTYVSFVTKWEQIADLTKGHVQPKHRWYLLVLLNVREYFDPLAPLYSTLFLFPRATLKLAFEQLS